MTTTVSQEAREAYLSMSMLPEFDAADVRAGRWDSTTGLQAFAKFEQSIRHQAERGEAWRPIETAPKDWTDVLVFSPEHEGFNCGGVFSAFYDTDDACWFTHGPGHNIRLHPTHWQPLPTPPEAS